MKLMDLMERLTDTTGLDVVTLPSLTTAVKNCMADLTSRGYKRHIEKRLTDLTVVSQNGTKIVLTLPTNPLIRKILNVRVFFVNRGIIARRLSATNPRVEAVYADNDFRTVLASDMPVVFYTKDTTITIEWNAYLGNVSDIALSYYAALAVPVINQNATETEILETEIDIKPEFEDALVLYAAYFYYMRYVKDVEKVQMFLNQYKYYIEDVSHELAFEEDYNEEPLIQVTDSN